MSERQDLPTKGLPATHAVLAQFDCDSNLSSVTENRAPAMLEVTGLPIIHHWLDRLKAAGVEHILIVSSRLCHQLKDYVKQGERWGFTSVEFISTGTITTWRRVLGLTRYVSEQTCVHASLNAFPMQALQEFSFCHDYWGNWEASRNYTLVPYPIQSLHNLWLINMWELRIQETPRFSNAIVDGSTRVEGKVSAGCRVVFGSQVTVSDSVIGGNVYVSESTEIRQCVVLNDSLLGSHLRLNRLIVDGSFIYDVDSRQELNIDDPNLFTRLQPQQRSVPLGEKLLACLLLIVTSPVWILSRTRKSCLKLVTGTDYAGEFITRKIPVSYLDINNQFAVRVPWLIQVVKGQLPLFGIRENSATVKRVPGVISRADFSDQTSITLQLANDYQTNHQSTTENLLMLVRWLHHVYKTGASHATISQP